MSLKQLIADGVTTAFMALGDLVEIGTLQADDVLDDVTEAVTPGASGAWPAVESEFNSMELAAGDVQGTDLKVLADNATKPFTPAAGHTFVFRGITYKVHAAKPTQEALWALHLKRPV